MGTARRNSGGVGGQLDSESFHDAEKGVEPGIAGGREGFVKGLACNAGLTGELRHSHGAGDVAEGGRD